MSSQAPQSPTPLLTQLSMELAPEGIFWFDDNGRFTYVNEAGRRATGYTLEELREMHIWDVDPSIPEERRTQVIETLQGEGTRRIDTTHMTKAGKTFPVEVVTCSFTSDGRKYGCAFVRDVSTRQRDEQALSMREHAIRSSLDATAFCSLDLKMTYINPAFVRMWGYRDAQEIIGRSPVEFWVDPDAAALSLNNVIEAGQKAGELKARRKDGSEFDVRHSTSLVTNRDGTPLCLMGSFVDITEQKRTVAALRDSERRFRSIVEATPLGLFLYEKSDTGDLIFLDSNAAADRILGIDTSDFVGLGITDAFPQLANTELPQRYREALDTGIPFHTEQFFYLDERISGAYDVHAFRVDDRHLTVLFADMSERVLARQSEQERSRRIQHQQTALLRMATNDAVVSGDLANALQAITLAAANGLSVDRSGIWLMNTSAGLLSCSEVTDVSATDCAKPCDINAETCGAYFAAIQDGRTIDALDARNDPRTSELRVEHLEPLGVTSTIDAPFHVGGTVAGVVRIEHRGPVRQWHPDEVAFAAQVADHATQAILNAQKREEEERRHALQAQMAEAQKLESLGLLAGGIAHDFNNLLMTILGNADLALQDLSDSHPARRSLSEIERASQRAADLCRQMLAYSGRGKFVLANIDINGMVREMSTLLRASVTKRATLRLELDPELPSIHGDPTQLRQVIMNLITNASDALGDWDGVIRLTTGVEQRHIDQGQAEPSTCVYLEVCDTGCGMDEETRGKIFDPFFTTKFTGRGLGLAAVQGIVRGHGGMIEVGSTPGEGTTFRVLIPVTSGPVDEQSSGPDTSDEWQGSGMILLADDEPTVRKVAQRLLKRLGFEVLLAEDGQEAVDLFAVHRDRIRGVILDMTMPRKDGAEALAEIRDMSGEVPIIVSSGYNEREVTQRFTGGKAAAFIQKPYQTHALAQTLRACLGDTDPDGS